MTAEWVNACTAATLVVPQNCGRLHKAMTLAGIGVCHLGMINASIAKPTIGRRQYPSKQQQLYNPRCCESGLSAPAMLLTTSQTTRLLTTLQPSITPKCSLPACSHDTPCCQCCHVRAVLCGAAYKLRCQMTCMNITDDGCNSVQTLVVCVEGLQMSCLLLLSVNKLASNDKPSHQQIYTCQQ